MKKNLTCTLLLLPVLLCLSPGAHGQLVDKRHFLWYTGHWSPTKKNVFIIEKDSSMSRVGSSGAGGVGTGGNGSSGTATLHPDGSVNVQTGGQDDWNKKVDAAIRDVDNWEKKLNDPANNMDPMDYHLSAQLLPQAEALKQEWQDYKIDPQQNLLDPATRPGGAANEAGGSASGNSGGSANGGSREANGSGGSANGGSGEANGSGGSANGGGGPTMESMASLCNASKADYDAVIAFAKAHARYNDADLNVAPPPEFEYNCYACDSNLRKVFDTAIRRYAEDFMQPEYNLLVKGTAIMKAFSKTGTGIETGVLQEANFKYFERSGPCGYFSYSDLAQAVYQLNLRLFWRAEKLLLKYHNKPRAAQSIAKVCLWITRQWAITCGDINADNEILADMAPLIRSEFDFYFQKLKKNDWRQVANIPYMIGLARQADMLEGGQNDDQFVAYIREITDIVNNFTLHVDMDIRTGSGGAFRYSHLQGQCRIRPDFDPDSNQCYSWKVADENRYNGLIAFSESKPLQQIDCNLLANEQVFPPQAPQWKYVGTKKYTVQLKFLKMDFCNPGKDTIVLSNFSPNPTNNGLWTVPYSPPQNLGVAGEYFFEDEMAKKRLAESGEAEKEAEKYKQQATDMIGQMRAQAAEMQADTGKKGFTDYQKLMDMKNKIGALTNNPVLSRLMFVDFELPVQNNASTIVNKSFDAKEINPRFRPLIEHGLYSILIENKSNEPKKHIINH